MKLNLVGFANDKVTDALAAQTAYLPQDTGISGQILKHMCSFSLPGGLHYVDPQKGREKVFDLFVNNAGI